MSGWYEYKGFRTIRRVDDMSACFHIREDDIHDGRLVDLTFSKPYSNNSWDFKFEEVSPSTCISLFRPSQQTVKITCVVKVVDYNLAIDKDGRTVLLVPSNPKDKYQHWIKQTASGLPVEDERGKKAFALVNKATGLAIKHGFGHNYLVQVAPFNTNYMDPSLLWTEDNRYRSSYFPRIGMQNNIDLVFTLFDDGRKYSLLGLSKSGKQDNQIWKIEYFE